MIYVEHFQDLKSMELTATDQLQEFLNRQICKEIVDVEYAVDGGIQHIMLVWRSV